MAVPPGYILCLALLIVLAASTWRQSHIYADSRTLWTDTLQKNPGCWMGHNNLGQMLAMEGKLEEAVPHFQEARRLKPDAAEVENNFGRALMLQGNPQAEDCFIAALRIDPQFRDAHVNYGKLLLRNRRYEQAADQFRSALRIGSDGDFASHNNLGSALSQLGHGDEAATHFQRALELNPECVPAWINLGMVRKAQGRLDEATRCFQTCLQCAGADPSLLANAEEQLRVLSRSTNSPLR
jgi:Flp pilus assembly protein TadD